MSAVPSALGQPDTDTVVTGDKLTRAALRGLSKPENTSGRFFAWIHYVDPHAEYMKHPGAPDLGTGMRAQYDGEVWFVDQQIGELLRFVASQPWGARTAVVVTSDHGEAFGEHRMIRHGFEIWEELVRVPLLVYVPGAAPRRVAERRSAVDLVPTLLDLFRVDPPSGDAKSDFVSGRSLLDDVLAPPGHEPEKRDVFVDMPAGPNNDERRAFVHDDLKLVLSNGVRWQLFDLAKDPGETEDLWEDEATRARILPRFQAFKSTLREVYVKPVPKD
jgi:arylsulfatase A-like enzyme